jgi:inosine/xanthosine triphosphatase
MNERENLMKLAVGTQNKAKLQAVEVAFGKVYPHIKATGFEVESGIAEQPTSDEESIQGAINRAQSALAKMATAQYGVGLEGNVVTISDRMFLHGWVAIIDQNGAIGLGHSSGLELPSSIRTAIEGGAELGPVLQEMLNDKDNEIRHSLGTNGVLSNGLYTRVDEFVDATTVALAKFAKPELY